MESGETSVVVRILRSGAKLLQQPGKTVTLTSYPPSQVMSKGKKFNKIPPLSPGQDRERKLKKIQNPVSLKDSSGPFNFGVRFTRNSKLCENTDWAFNYKYKRLYVDMDGSHMLQTHTHNIRMPSYCEMTLASMDSIPGA